MSVSNNYDYLDKGKLSDTSFMQNEKNISIKKEPVFACVPIKSENKKNEYEIELCGEIKQDSAINKLIKQEEGFQCHTNNLEEIQQVLFAVNDINTENVKKADSCIEATKELLTIKAEEEWKHKDTSYKIDIEECKVESSVGNDSTVKSIYEDSIASSSSTVRDTVSVIEIPKEYAVSEMFGSCLESSDQEIHKQSKICGCEMCRKVFAKVQNRKRHTNGTSKSTKRYGSNECQKMFSTARHRKVHTNRLHEGIQIYECDECHKKFSEVCKLKRHIYGMHKFTYECEVCHKVFPTSGSLRKHIDGVHNKIKNYECNACNKTFFQLGNLKDHIFRVHERIKNYECSLCHKMFSQSDRKEHIERVHKRNKCHKCNECHKMFLKSSELKTHVDIIHKKLKIMSVMSVTKYFYML